MPFSTSVSVCGIKLYTQTDLDPHNTLDKLTSADVDSKSIFTYMSLNETKVNYLESNEEVVVRHGRELLWALQEDDDRLLQSTRRGEDVLSRGQLFSQRLEDIRAKVDGSKYSRIFKSETGPRLLVQMLSLGPHFRKATVLQVNFLYRLIGMHGGVSTI